MSNAAKLAEILKRLGDAHYQAADELIALAGEQPLGGGVSTPAPADDLPEFPPLEVETRPEPQGSLAMCPIHRVAFSPGKFGYAYCKEKGIDPAWTNQRGYCRLNEKNVHEYRQSRSAVA